MLELFFDNEKSFSVFEMLLKADEPLAPSDIGLELGISPRHLRRIINDFDILGIVKYESPLEIVIDVHNPITMGICIFDKLVSDYYLDETSKKMKEIEENGSLEDILRDESFQKILSSANDMSLDDFVNGIFEL